MKWTSQASACLVAVALVGGCNAPRDRGPGAAGTGNETGATGDTSAMTDTSAMVRDTTGTSGMPADTGMKADTAKTPSGKSGSDTAKNQTKSGTTDSAR
jgi:hypothetical protein